MNCLYLKKKLFYYTIIHIRFKEGINMKIKKNYIVKILITIVALLILLMFSTTSCSNFIMNIQKSETTYIDEDNNLIINNEEEEKSEFKYEYETIDVNTDLGVITVKKNPVRVISLFNEATETIVSLDFSPTAYLNSIDNDSKYSWVEMMYENGMSKNAIDLHSFDLHTIKLLEPDLILGSYEIHGDYYEELSEIAPTIFSQTAKTSFNFNYLLFAEAIDKKKEAEQNIVNYFIRCNEIARKYNVNKNDYVNIVEITKGMPFLVLENNFSAEVMKDMNFNFYNIISNNKFKTEVVLEGLKGDNVIVSVTPDEVSEKTLYDWVEYMRKVGYENRNLYLVPTHIWDITNGYISAMEIVDSVEYILSGFDEIYKVDTIEKINLD